MRVFVKIVLVAAAAWLLLCVLVFLFQRRLQYFPDASRVPLPARQHAAGLREVRFAADDGVDLCAWHWPGERPGTLLLLHGNAGHRGHRLEWIEGLHALGWGVLALDYRGYGGSGGRPAQEGLLRDAEAAAAFIAREGSAPVVYVGESLGCSVAVLLAARRPPSALVLQAGALSLVDVARRAYPILPVGLLMRDRFDLREAMRTVTCPLLSIHGTHDGIVPIDFGRALFDAAGGPKEFFEVAGAGHNDLLWVAGEAWYRRLDTFLREQVR